MRFGSSGLLIPIPIKHRYTRLLAYSFTGTRRRTTPTNIKLNADRRFLVQLGSARGRMYLYEHLKPIEWDRINIFLVFSIDMLNGY